MKCSGENLCYWRLLPANVFTFSACRLLAASAFCLTAYLTILFFAASLIAGIYAVFTPADAGVIERTEKQYDLQRQKYARSIEEVMRTTRYWIATNPDDRSAPLPVEWKDGIPLGDITGTGLHPSSVMPGVKARYCDNILLVYLDDHNQKGIGPDDLRLIQTARVKAYIQRTRRNALGRPAPLQWLGEDGKIEPPSFPYSRSPPPPPPPPLVPECMKDGLLYERPALIDSVIDPATRGADINIKRIEYRTSTCPAEESGTYKIHESRTGTRRYNGKRGGWQGATVWEVGEDGEEWQEESNFCKKDHTKFTIKKVDCDFPDPLVATYEETRTVTRGKTASSASKRKSTCPEASLRNKIPDLPTDLTDVYTRETRSSGCPSDYTGSVSLARTKTVRTTTFPRGQDPITTTFHSNWAQTANSCHLSTPLRYSGGGRDPADADGDGVDASDADGDDLDDHDPNITGRCCRESGSR